MQRRILLLGASLLILNSIINWGCSKLDTTDIGSDQIPAVDNVHTFADTLDITTTQGVFNDTTLVYRTDDHVVGKISNDPLFGQTNAEIYVQLKPTFYPFYYGRPKDTINNALVPGTGFDSAVLCLNYKGFWGDSLIPLNFEIRAIDQNNGLFDSVYTTRDINYSPRVLGPLLGSKSIDVKTLGSYFVHSNHRDSSVNQIRIPFNSSFANLLFARDTNAIGNNSFRSDSLFKVFNNGFAITVSSGNGLAYCNLADTNTKIEVHYKYRNGGIIDTAYTSLQLNSATYPSSTANHIVRTRPGTVPNPPATELYLQTTPGTYANLRFPGLDTMRNRIIHRAELIIQQIPDNPTYDNIFTAPGYLYVDLKDTGTTQRWKPIYKDLSPNELYYPDEIATFSQYFPFTGGVDYLTFGGYRRDGVDKFGNANHYYNINISRYVQQIVTNHIPNYTLRLYAPSYLYYPQVNGATYIQYGNLIGKGRVKVGSGTNPNYKMRLRIIYSNI